MRQIYLLLLVALVGLGVTSCSDEYDYTEYSNSDSDSDDDDDSTLKYITLDYLSLDMYVGEEQVITASPYPADITSMDVTWSSDNDYVATVDTDGKVTAVGYGSATITATSDDDSTISATCTIEVDESVEYTLATIPSSGLTIDSNSWIITDGGTPSAASFETLKEALYSAYRDIKLEFPNIEGFANEALKFVAPEEDDDDDDDSDTLYFALTSIVAPVATTIGEEAFSGCEYLESITIGSDSVATVTSLGAWAFASCKSLTDININLSNITSIEEGVFYNCESLESMSLPDVTSIASSSFYSCDKLVSVSLPLITSVPDDAFSWCYSLESIEAPLVELIGSWGFGGCKSLLAIDMPLTTEVGDMAFYNCAKLADIDLAAAESVGANAFYSCISMSSLNLASTSSSITVDSTAFIGVYTRDYVTLTTTANNGSTISGTKWTVDDTSFDFLAIIEI